MGFITHGYYTISNNGGYEIMLSDCGGQAKIKDSFGNDEPVISDWLNIEYYENEDDSEDSGFIIDKDGYNIPLNMVIRA